MFPLTSGGFSFTVALADEQATRQLVADIAGLIEPGDLITLSGDLGAGKSTFARAFIRHVAGDESIEVPSPTFTLMQAYELPRFSLVHADLYRLSGPAELAELGFEDIAERTVVLLEWPDRAAGFLPPDRLDVALTLSPQQGPNFRNARITGYGAFAARAERIAAIRKFLERNGYGKADRRRIRRRLDAQLRAPHDAGALGHPDEFAEAPGRTAGARRQTLQRHRASGGKRDAVRGNGEGAAPTRLFGAGDPFERPRRRPAGDRGSRRRDGGCRRSAGADRGAL